VIVWVVSISVDRFNYPHYHISTLPHFHTNPYLYLMPFETLIASELIPHKSPFVLVDKLLYADEKRSCCSFKIPEGNIFVEQGYYSTPGMVESMAQTAAAGTGYLFKKENKPVPVGYIGSVQKLEVIDWPPVNVEITMEISLLTNILQVSLVSCLVKYEGRIMASCEMKIFVNSLL
jgi:predicted hotdog family 3-hydroxylacyl-ACP dehydratase